MDGKNSTNLTEPDSAVDQLHLKYIPISSDLFWEENPNAHDLGMLADSLEKHGFRNPPIWDNNLNGGRGGVAGGNGRIKTLLWMQAQRRQPPRAIVAEGDEWLVPVIFGCDADSEAQAMAYAIDDNNLTMAGGNFTAVDIANNWDKEAYLKVLQRLAEADVMPVSVDHEDLDLLLSLATPKAKVSPEEEQEQTDEDLEKAEKEEFVSRVQDGDIWQLGAHFLACGDSTYRSNLKALLGDQEPKLVWADPPYGMNAVRGDRTGYGKKGQYGKAAANGEYEPIEGDDTPDTAIDGFKACEEFLCTQIWWGANYFPHIFPISKSWIVWDKENDFAYKFADAEIAYCSECNLPIRIIRHQWSGMIKASERGEKRVHPTQKPIELFKLCAEQYGNPGDVILDPFAGSGISIMGAEMMADRTVFAMEKSAVYCEIILKRYERLFGGVVQKVGEI